MLSSKRRRGRPIPDQVDDRAQRSKDKDKEENPKNDQVSVCNYFDGERKITTHSWKTTIDKIAG
jgi:hypothetical protein